MSKTFEQMNAAEHLEKIVELADTLQKQCEQLNEQLEGLIKQI